MVHCRYVVEYSAALAVANAELETLRPYSVSLEQDLAAEREQSRQDRETAAARIAKLEAEVFCLCCILQIV